VQHLFDLVLSVQRKLQGMLGGYVATLFDSPEGFALGMSVAVALGLVHALTPGHGKSVIFSYFLGQRGSVLEGMRIAATAALTHGTIAVLLVLLASRVLSPLGRPTGAAAWLEVIAGAIVAAIGAFYVVFSLRGLRCIGDHAHRGAASRSLLAVAMGLLPCPLTIIVVGVAVAQGATGQGIALAAGISLGAAVTIGCFGLLGLALRAGGVALAGPRTQHMMLALGWLEMATSLLILLFGLLMLNTSLGRLL
jgi:ABC-type nickel/cobalt efflux system permease component RcnA